MTRPQAEQARSGDSESDADSSGGNGSRGAGLKASLSRFRERVRSLPGGRLGWRIGVTVLGVLVVVGGVALLPLPGPGWLIIFAGLGLLATEYAWAADLLKFARRKVQEWTHWLGRKPRWVHVLVGVATVAIVVAVVWLYWVVTH